MTRNTSNTTALLEIGTEEIPSRFIDPALQQLKSSAEKNLAAAMVTFKSVETFGTPRRLTVMIKGLSQKAEDRVDVAIGPPPAAAKDAAGEWTKAATGFAKAQKISVKKLVLKNTPKGERYVAEHHIRGKKTESVLKELFPALITGLNFPKSMIWEESGFRFARPIRWIVSLCNTRVIHFRLAGVQADKNTYGLLALGYKKIPISKPERYLAILQNRCIIGDPEDRREKILGQIESLAKKIKGKPVLDEGHVTEVIHLTEYPTCIPGHFPESYLKLPREVLVSVLKKHQKFFPIESAKGQLVNAFIGVRNGPTESQETVRDGYERVLLARLADAQFFFEQDAGTDLEKTAERLSEVNFLEGKGTLLDKTNRVKNLVQTMGELLLQQGDQSGLSTEKLEKAVQGAGIANADLLTQMVGEFPELQGVAGRFYALGQGKDPEVAAVIEEHYWPLTSDGRLPDSPLSSLVALADKIETLVSHFNVGHVPTGSADPHGLRRHALGIIRILIHQRWALSLSQIVDVAVEAYGSGLSGSMDDLKNSLKEFFRQRCTGWFSNQGFRSDEIESVLAMDGEALPILNEKLHALKTVRGRSEFSALATAVKRAGNIIKQARSRNLFPDPLPTLNPDELSEECEKSLLSAIQDIRPKFNEGVEQHQFQEALLSLASLKNPVDSFFEGVMVMVDDEKLRNQRLALLHSIENLFRSLVDFSKLQETPNAADHR